jgi:hypothetical protein
MRARINVMCWARFDRNPCFKTGAMGATLLVAAFGSAVGLAFSEDENPRPEALQAQKSRLPTPLRGVPLLRKTGLALVVADLPPFVLNVDSGRIQRIADIQAAKRKGLWVVSVAGKAAVVVAKSAPHARIYGLRGPRSAVSYLGTGENVWPASSGRAAWIQRMLGPSRCTLRGVALDGGVIRRSRPFPCASRSDPAGGSLGLVVNRTRVIDPLTRRTILKTRSGIIAVAGKKIVLAGPDDQFTLIDAASNAKWRLAWPSILSGLDQPAVDPRGRIVALAFADPAWAGKQALDVWLLDTKTRKLVHLPGMPAFVALKETSMVWTDDGRLVLLARSGGKNWVALWRSGQRRLALKAVRLGQREAGSDSFAAIR